MTLREVARIPLPAHPPGGEFDHAAVDPVGDRLYVAHPSNDAVEVVELRARRHHGSLPGLRGVAGVWVDAGARLLFTSNRSEDTASIFRLSEEGVTELFRVPTGARPNGMAFDPARNLLAVAGVGNAKEGLPPTLTIFDAEKGKRLHQIVLPGRTRWATYHKPTEAFYVNIADPSRIAEVPAGDPSAVRRFIDIPGVGPHGMEQDPDGSTLYCACDGGQLVAVELPSGRARVAATLAGPPDVLWMDGGQGHLYAAVGDPAVVQVFRTHPLALLETLPTSADAHTLTVDPRRHEVHVFLPGTHKDLVLGVS